MAVSLAAFVAKNESIRIHAEGCSHTLRETRAHGIPVIVTVDSELGLIRALKAKGIRSNDLYFLRCCGVVESFPVYAPNGERVSASSTRKAAVKATGRIKREARREVAEMAARVAELKADLSVFARMELDNASQS